MYQMATVILGTIVLLIAWQGYERWKWQKIKKDGIRCEFTTDTGQVIRKLGKLGPKMKQGTLVIIKDRSGMVLHDDEGGQKLDTTLYFITTDSTYNEDVPENALFKALVQVNVPKAYYKLGDPCPKIFKGTTSPDTAAIIGHLHTEKATAIAVRESMRNDKRDKALTQMINPLVMYVGLGLIGLAVVIGIYFSYKASSDMSDMSTKIDAMNTILKNSLGGQ